MVFDHQKNKGFTLIELLIVIAIIGILASVVLSSLNSARAKGRDARRQIDIHEITSALTLYYDDHQYYPDGNGPTGLKRSNVPAEWSQFSGWLAPYMKTVPVDPTNVARFIYTYESSDVFNEEYSLNAQFEKGIGDHYLIDFGSVNTTTTGWNNPSMSASRSSLVDISGSATTASFIFTAPVSGPSSGSLGETTSTVYPSTATIDCMWISTGNVISFNIDGLNPAKIYSFKFYGSRAGVTDNRTTDYTIGGTTVSLNAASNINNTVSITGVTPNASGTVSVSLTTNAANLSYAYLSVLEIIGL